MNEPSSLRARRNPATSHREPRYDAQPSLLDRLTAHRAPKESGKPSAERNAPPRAALREAILRDLGWLMNSTHLEAVDNLDAYPHVQRSVVNFGMNALAGSHASADDWACVESALRDAIAQFEPRILADSIEVRCTAAPYAIRQGNTLPLEISGQFWADGVPQAFALRSEIDFENSRFTLRSPGMT